MSAYPSRLPAHLAHQELIRLGFRVEFGAVYGAMSGFAVTVYDDETLVERVMDHTRAEALEGCWFRMVLRNRVRQCEAVVLPPEGSAQ